MFEFIICENTFDIRSIKSNLNHHFEKWNLSWCPDVIQTQVHEDENNFSNVFIKMIIDAFC